MSLQLTPQDTQILVAILNATKQGMQAELQQGNADPNRAQFLAEAIAVCDKFCAGAQQARGASRIPPGANIAG